jgi:hypothetical protein
MIGPALMLLFNELDSRKDKQTAYEKRLYRELLALGGVSGEEFPGRPTGREFRGVDMSKAVRGRQRLDRGIAGNVIGRQNVDEPARLQINCGNPNCPNKEFK